MSVTTLINRVAKLERRESDPLRSLTNEQLVERILSRRGQGQPQPPPAPEAMRKLVERLRQVRGNCDPKSP